MRHVFALLIGELTHYRLFDVSSSMVYQIEDMLLTNILVSGELLALRGDIQHYLHKHANAEFVSGSFTKSKWAMKTRNRLMDALQKLSNVPTVPIVVGQPFHGLHSDFY